MTTGLPVKADEILEAVRRRNIYTSCSRMNEMLNEFARTADHESIWISIDAREVSDKMLVSQFCDIIKMALAVAQNNCIETTLPRNRWIRLCCRNMQAKMFAKITYSCESQEICESDANIGKICSIIDTYDEGYFDIRLDGDAGDIRIAIPT